MKTLPFSIVLTLIAVQSTDVGAFGSDDRWTSGWGQGIQEAIILKGPGNSIYATCDSGAGRDSTAIHFSLRDKEPTGSSIQLTFDSLDPEDYSIWDGRIPSNCNACASVYIAVRDKLRSHSSVHVKFQNGDSARFTLRGSARAIPLCTPDFWR